MPFTSEAQRRLFYAKERAGELPAGTAARWESHTPKKKLPPRVGEKREVEDKKAFVHAFLLKCASSGVTEPAALAAAAEKFAFFSKAASALGDIAKGTAGLAMWGPLLGHVAPVIAGSAVGVGAAHMRNQMNRDDTKVMRLAALANAYRRRTAEAQTNAQVHKVIEQDPSRYVVLG